MNTVADKLMKLVQTKSDIRQALLDKGFNVPDTMPFSGYADLIRRFPCNAKDFPDIPGMIARWSAKGLTNEDMSTNPVWKDLTGNGHDFQMKNFGWAEMSGVGGYNQNFNRWSYTNLHNATETHTSNKIELNVIDAGNRTGNIYSTLFPVGYIFDFNIKVTGLKDPCFILVSKGTTESIIKITNDGIYNIKATVDESWDQRRIYFIINNSGGSLFDGLVIEQLPLYPGALVFDGVDDYGICDNFPILTKEKGYTVVALRRWLVLKPTGYYTLISNSNQRQEGAFNAEDFKMQAKGTFSWGNYTQNLNKTNASFMFQTSTSYNGGTIRGEAVEKGNDFLQVCKIGSFCSNVAIWEICILDHDATEEEIQKIQDYYKQEYPWLFPDQAWTVTGKTNEDTDRATIDSITGNGNNLVLSNFGFAENSGYGLYYQYFGNGFKTTNGEIIGGSWNKINNYNISCNIRMPINSIGKCFWDSSVLTTGIKLRFKLTGMAEGDVLAFGYTNVYDLTYTSDGIYIIELTPTDKSCGFSLQSSLTENLPTTQVTIELLPFDYEGYLVTDGVDDKIQSSNFSMGKDFTVVGEWKMLKNSDTYELAGINKHDSFILYNYSYNNRINVYIYSGQGTPINTDSIKAFTSTGLIYIDDFNNVEEVIPRDKTDRGYSLFIGYNNNVFTKLAFKNLAIYSEVLSKEDCIKAYNYLQTLKS